MLEVLNLSKFYKKKKIWGADQEIKALDSVSFKIKKGECLGIVGESGCGKSTLAKTLLGIENETSGMAKIDGKSRHELGDREWHKKIQMVFQDPYSSLNPRMKAIELIAAPLMINEKITLKDARGRALQMLSKVGLRAEMAERYPHMLSGGQRQRIGIARALMLRPSILICDEPVSALDVSIQAQVLNLLMDLQDEFELTLLFISHDLHVIKHISHEILVMYLGSVAEFGSRDLLVNSPLHPYTQALLGSIPGAKGIKLPPLEGELPSPLNPPSGCSFHKRCPKAQDSCKINTPAPLLKSGRIVSCDLVNP